MHSDDELLTTAETAREFRISPHTLRDWRDRDEGPPFVRHGRFIRYRRGSLRAWAAAREVSTGGAA